MHDKIVFVCIIDQIYTDTCLNLDGMGEQTMFREIFSNSKIRLDVSSYDARPNWKTCMIQRERKLLRRQVYQS